MTDYLETRQQLAAEFRRPLCDVRNINGTWELYMAGGAWLPVEMVRDMKEEAAEDTFAP